MSFKRLEQAVHATIARTIADVCTFTPTISGVAVQIAATFEMSFVVVDSVESYKPILRVNLKDFAATPVRGDSVAVNSQNYKVDVCQLDSFGGATLILKKA